MRPVSLRRPCRSLVSMFDGSPWRKSDRTVWWRDARASGPDGGAINLCHVACAAPDRWRRGSRSLDSRGAAAPPGACAWMSQAALRLKRPWRLRVCAHFDRGRDTDIYMRANAGSGTGRCAEGHPTRRRRRRMWCCRGAGAPAREGRTLPRWSSGGSPSRWCPSGSCPTCARQRVGAPAATPRRVTPEISSARGGSGGRGSNAGPQRDRAGKQWEGTRAAMASAEAAGST